MGKKKIGGLILLALLIITGFGLYLARPKVAVIVKDVPILNQLFKIQSDELSTKSKDALIKEIEALEEERNNLKENYKKIELENQSLIQEIARLQEYEKEYEVFDTKRKQWEKEVAYLGQEGFIDYYESIDPEHAKTLYLELKKVQVFTQEQKDYAKIIGEMDEDQGAAALEMLVGTDPELVKFIFEGMPKDKQSVLLSAMEQETAARVIKLIAPDLN